MSELAIFRSSFFDAPPSLGFPSGTFSEGASIFSLEARESKTIFQACCTGDYSSGWNFAQSGYCDPYCNFKIYIAHFTISNVPGEDNLSSIVVTFFNQGTILRLSCVQNDMIIDNGLSKGIALSSPFDRIDVTTVSPSGQSIPDSEPKFGYYSLTLGVANSY